MARHRITMEKVRADKAEADLAALETIVAQESHAVGISGMMTPADRVRTMRRAIVAERNMSCDCQAKRNATIAKNHELNQRATKAEGALVQMTKRAEAAETANRENTERLQSVALDAAKLADERYQAQAERDALRAEVAALRGLADNHGAMCRIVDEVKDKETLSSTYHRVMCGISATLAAVPSAKVGEAPKVEPAGLEPLRPIHREVTDLELSQWIGAITVRVNELSAIAKRGAR